MKTKYELHQQVAALTAERDALRAQLAQATRWRPVTADTAPIHIAKPFPAVVQMSREGDLFIAQPDIDGVMSDDATVIMLRLDDTHAFCERVDEQDGDA